jgi:hypothetical protein
LVPEAILERAEEARGRGLEAGGRRHELDHVDVVPRERRDAVAGILDLDAADVRADVGRPLRELDLLAVAQRSSARSSSSTVIERTWPKRMPESDVDTLCSSSSDHRMRSPRMLTVRSSTAVPCKRSASRAFSDGMSLTPFSRSSQLPSFLSHRMNPSNTSPDAVTTRP